MADDVSTGELARRLDQVLQIVQTLVSRPEYTADQRHNEHRFTEIEADIKDLRFDLASQKDRRGADWRQALYAGLVPAALVLAGILFQVLRGT